MSSTGNTILGKRKLRTGISFDPVTKVCQKEMTERLGRKVHIVDTPGFPIKMGEYNNSNTLEKISEANSLLDMKTNVLLLIIPIDRFTEDHRNMLRFLQNIDGLSEHVIAIFNRVDDVTDPIPELRQKIAQSSTLETVLHLSSGRFALLDNTSEDIIQVTSLFEMIEDLIKQNNGTSMNLNFKQPNIEAGFLLRLWFSLKNLSTWVLTPFYRMFENRLF